MIISVNEMALIKEEVKKFYKRNRIQNHASAPYHLNINEQRERMVQCALNYKT